TLIYPARVRGRQLDAVVEASRAAVRALGIASGPAHVELCTTASGPRLYELGARCGGGATPDPIVPFVTGIEQPKETVRVALGDPPMNLTPLAARGCVYGFFSPRPGTIAAVCGV